jgi:NitT/TauT family transport system substrate-binding protein
MDKPASKPWLAAILIISLATLSVSIRPTLCHADSIRFGTIPALQALPLFVASEMALFKAEGIEVELKPFNTAAQTGMAIAAGELQGYFADLFTPVTLISNGVDLRIVAINYHTGDDRRMFGLMVKPGSQLKTLKDLANVPVAVSSNSVIDYVTELLLKRGGVPLERQKTVESKNIGLRMQLLLSGALQAATLPEPLVTAASAKGAGLIADDRGIRASQTALVFTSRLIRDDPASIKAFLSAIRKANKIINQSPDKVRPIMVKHVRLPRVLQDKYVTPRFPPLKGPDKEALQDALSWLKARGSVRPELRYQDIAHEGIIQ